MPRCKECEQRFAGHFLPVTIRQEVAKSLFWYCNGIWVRPAILYNDLA